MEVAWKPGPWDKPSCTVGDGGAFGWRGQVGRGIGPGRLYPGSGCQACPEALSRVIITGGPGILPLQKSPHPSHRLRMPRGAHPHPGVGLLESGQPSQEAVASTRALRTGKHQAAAGGNMGNTAAFHL